MRKPNINKIFKALLILFFAFGFMTAGVFHFIRPEHYYQIIPPYLSHPETLNLLAGAAECVLGLGLLFMNTRQNAAYGLILLLCVFFTVHIYMIVLAPFNLNGMEISSLMAWLRLFLQFPFIWITYYISKQHFSLFNRFRRY